MMNSLLQFLNVNHFIGNNYLILLLCPVCKCRCCTSSNPDDRYPDAGQSIRLGAPYTYRQHSAWYTIHLQVAFALLHHTRTGSIRLGAPYTYRQHSPRHTIHLQEAFALVHNTHTGSIASVHHTLTGSIGLGK